MFANLFANFSERVKVKMKINSYEYTSEYHSRHTKNEKGKSLSFKATGYFQSKNTTLFNSL